MFFIISNIANQPLRLCEDSHKRVVDSSHCLLSPRTARENATPRARVRLLCVRAAGWMGVVSSKRLREESAAGCLQPCTFESY
jgi:hypothetical protein